MRLLRPHAYKRGASAVRPRRASICSTHHRPLYSERERAALAWTAALISEIHVPDAIYDHARQQFSETELVNLTLRVAAINARNRIAIGFRAVHPTHWRGAV
jgi:alkylhydroperoxidase family enzyme